MNTDTVRRYGRFSIAMHWLMLLLIAAVYLCMELTEDYPKGDPTRELLKYWHFTLGLTVFVLVWLRLLLRLIGPTPAIVPPAADWELRLAKVTHGLLYLFMIAMPIGGWLTLSAAGKPVPFYGFELPHLIGQNKELAEEIGDVHETIGNIGYFLIGLHAAAALFHHYVRRDNTFRRMLPWS